MTYSSLKPRLAKRIPELSDEQIRLALPTAIGGATVLGALAYNAVAPLDVDPVGLAVGTGLALGTQGRTPYNYAGLAALGLEGARYLNNAFTNTRDTEASPLIAMGIGAGALGLRESLRRGTIRYEDVGFPTTGRMAQDLGKLDATIPINDVVVTEPSRSVAAPPKPPTKPTKPTPRPRTATDSTVAPVNPNTGDVSVVVPAPTIEDYIAKSPLLNRERAMSYANPDSPDYQPNFVKMLTQDLSDDFRATLAFPDDVLRETFKGSGVPAPVATGAIYLPIRVDAFQYPKQKPKLNSDVIVFRGSNLIGGEGKSEMVNQGVVPEGTYYPNAVTSNAESLGRLATPSYSPEPTGAMADLGLFVKNKGTGTYDQVLDISTEAAKQAYNQLTQSGRMAVPMAQKNLGEPMLYVDELSGGSSPYDINDFYGLRSAKKRTTDKITGEKYYKGVYDKAATSKARTAVIDDELLDIDYDNSNPIAKPPLSSPYSTHLDLAQEWIDDLPLQKYYQTTDAIDAIVDEHFNKGLEAYGLNPKTMPSNLRSFRQALGEDDFSQTAFVNQYLKAQGQPELPLPPLVLPEPITDPEIKGIFYY